MHDESLPEFCGRKSKLWSIEKWKEIGREKMLREKFHKRYEVMILKI